MAMHLFIDTNQSTTKKGSPVHVAPACAGSGEGSDHFGSYVLKFSLHFCKRLLPGLEPYQSTTKMTKYHFKNHNQQQQQQPSFLVPSKVG
jgi:hypothetical protein